MTVRIPSGFETKNQPNTGGDHFLSHQRPSLEGRCLLLPVVVSIQFLPTMKKLLGRTTNQVFNPKCTLAIWRPIQGQVF
jgi:hypothetical protein